MPKPSYSDAKRDKPKAVSSRSYPAEAMTSGHHEYRITSSYRALCEQFGSIQNARGKIFELLDEEDRRRGRAA